MIHRRHGHGKNDPAHVSCFVLTVSDTRKPQTDESGRTILEHIEGEGHRLAGYAVVKDDATQVAKTLREAVRKLKPDVVLVNGGTGISRRDTTYEAIEGMIEKGIPGFGEAFRWLSFQEIGPLSLLSRASAGIYKSTVVFSLPGSPEAVRLAMNKLIVPVMRHAVGEIRRNS